MREYLAMTILALALIQSSRAAATDEHHHEHGEAAKPTLTLNDGQKWISDKHTTESVTAMASLIRKMAPDATTADLQALGGQLHEQLQNLIRGCKMTGSAHDQLHLWITLVAPEIEGLTKLQQAEDGPKALARLSTLMAQFDEHFQLVDQEN
jgi:hypothetical protein